MLQIALRLLNEKKEVEDALYLEDKPEDHQDDEM